MEVSSAAWEVARRIESYVQKVVVVSPDDTGIAHARTKTDKIDARTLATLASPARAVGLVGANVGLSKLVVGDSAEFDPRFTDLAYLVEREQLFASHPGYCLRRWPHSASSRTAFAVVSLAQLEQSSHLRRRRDRFRSVPSVRRRGAGDDFGCACGTKRVAGPRVSDVGGIVVYSTGRSRVENGPCPARKYIAIVMCRARASTALRNESPIATAIAAAPAA
jgi:hypothetical protein